MRHRSRGWLFKRRGRNGTTWYVGYFVDVVKDGTTVRTKRREAVGPDKGAAAARLDEYRRRIHDGSWEDPAKPLTFDDLLRFVRNHWRNKGRKSTLTLSGGTEQAGIRRLRDAFGSLPVVHITAATLAQFADARMEAGAAISTVRNDLNVLKLGMHLAKRQSQLATVPAFPELTPRTVRSGFFERDQLDLLLAELAEHAHAPALFLYLTGWRRNEAVTRQWSHVDLEAGTIRLDPGETKSGKGRTFTFGVLPELKALIEAQRAYTDEVQRRTGQIVPWVFHREGRPIRSFRTAWRAACRRSGIQRIPHDFRRTAARNMRRAGLSESDIMELCGWETREMFKRYAIKDEAALGAAVKRYAAATPERVLHFGPKRTQKAAQG